MRVLVACEFSGTVRDAFAARGHDAWSCDLLPSETEGQHIQGDVLAVLDRGWDLMIAHPPCTHLAVAGNKWFGEKYKDRFPNKAQQREDGLAFVLALMNASIPKVAIENPVSVISSRIRKPDQIVQPWMFGHEASKKTCLWLRGLPLLQPTQVVGVGEHVVFASGKRMPRWYTDIPAGQDRWKVRSATFSGIAAAMAEQWGG